MKSIKKSIEKEGNNYLKKNRESTKLDDEDKKNIKLIEDYFKLFD